MADYYTQFSLEVGPLSKKEADWFAKRLPDPEDEYEDDQVDCEWSLSPIQGKPKKFSVWFQSDGEGSIEPLVNLLTAFLGAYRPKQAITLVWSCTCSKPRLDGFGGGACVITAKKMHWIDAQAWAEKKVAALNLKELA